VKFWHFAVATFLTLPKQIILVYVGVLLVQQSSSDTVNAIVLGGTFIVTLVAGVYVYLKMRKTKKVLLEEQEARLSLKRSLSEEFDPDVERGFVQPPTDGPPQRFEGRVYVPASEGEWQGGYEMDARPAAKMAEFI